MLSLVACSHHADPPVTPAPPLPAATEIKVGTMDDECNGLVGAIEQYRACPNLDDNDREWLRQLIVVSEDSLAAGKKGNPDANSQHTIALACRRAAVSIGFANQRCHNGAKPRVD